MRSGVVHDGDSLSARAYRGDQEMHAPKLKHKPLHREWGGNGERDGQDLGGAHRSDEHHTLARALAVVDLNGTPMRRRPTVRRAHVM